MQNKRKLRSAIFKKKRNIRLERYLLNKNKAKETNLNPVHEAFIDQIKPPDGQGNGAIAFNWSILIFVAPFLIYFLDVIEHNFITYILLVYSIIMVFFHTAIMYFLYRKLGNLLNPQNLITNSLMFFALSTIYLGITFYYLWTIDHTQFTGPSPDLSVFDMIYYSFVTVATLGYGDILPNSILTKILTIFQIIYGIWFLITVVPVLVADQAERLKKYRINHQHFLEVLKTAEQDGKVKRTKFRKGKKVEK